MIIEPSKLLSDYWAEHFSSYSNFEMMDCSKYLEELSESSHIDKAITLFPFDNLKPEKHAVAPDTHYHLLNKVTLAELGVQCPSYSSYNLHTKNLEDIQLPQFPYLIKTSHGLSGEGTYIIRNISELNIAWKSLGKILKLSCSIQLLSQISSRILYRITVYNSILIKQEKLPSSAL